MPGRADAVMGKLMQASDPAVARGMARYGIAGRGVVGVPLPALTAMARQFGPDHDLALELWDTGVHEARILAAMVDDPGRVSKAQLNRWITAVDSWDLCDQLCLKLVARTSFGYELVEEWCVRPDEYVRRAGFAIMAIEAVHDKRAPDERFVRLLPLIEEGAGDGRNAVRKAVSWALRQIGKRSPRLNGEAIACAERIGARGGKAERWVASDVLRELRSDKVARRIGRRTR